MRNSAKPLEQLYGRLPFAVQAKLYNHQALTDEEQVRHQAVLTAIAAAEERQHQATLAIFAKYCTMLEDWLPHIEDSIRNGDFEMDTRIIFKCKCGQAWPHDYERNARGLSRTWEPAPEDTNQHPISTPEWDKRCPKCQHTGTVKTNEVIGTVTSKPCSEQCMTATSHVCNCSCGGKNHGRAHL